MTLFKNGAHFYVNINKQTSKWKRINIKMFWTIHEISFRMKMGEKKWEEHKILSPLQWIAIECIECCFSYVPLKKMRTLFFISNTMTFMLMTDPGEHRSFFVLYFIWWSLVKRPLLGPMLNICRNDNFLGSKTYQLHGDLSESLLMRLLHSTHSQ